MLEQIKNKVSLTDAPKHYRRSATYINTIMLCLQSINLKPVVAKRPNVMGGPRTNLQVAAILERANAIRQVDHLEFIPCTSCHKLQLIIALSYAAARC
jgi:hypothetical protein